MADVRPISTDEYLFALSIFQSEFPPKDHIFLSSGTSPLGGNYTRPTMAGNLRVYLGGKFEHPMYWEAIFAHELTHCFQYAHHGFWWYVGHAFNDDLLHPIDNQLPYTCDPDKNFGHYGFEQQAAIVENYVLKGEACETAIVERAFFHNPWKLMIGSDAGDVAVDADGTLYMISRLGWIYRYNGKDWDKLAGSDAIAVAANGGRVVIANNHGLIYEFGHSNWEQLPGDDAVDVAVAADGNIFMVNSHGKIYNYHDSGGWIQMSGSNGHRIAAGGGQLWLVNLDGKIYHFAGNAWTQVSGSDGQDICVSGEGKVYLTNRHGKIYVREGETWRQLEGSDGNMITANNGRIVLANTAGRIFTRPY